MEYRPSISHPVLEPEGFGVSIVYDFGILHTHKSIGFIYVSLAPHTDRLKVT
jgi:hypothetical protein